MMAFFVGMDYWWCGWIWRRPLGDGLRRLVHEVIHPVVVVVVCVVIEQVKRERRRCGELVYRAKK